MIQRFNILQSNLLVGLIGIVMIGLNISLLLFVWYDDTQDDMHLARIASENAAINERQLNASRDVFFELSERGQRVVTLIHQNEEMTSLLEDIKTLLNSTSN